MTSSPKLTHTIRLGNKKFRKIRIFKVSFCNYYPIPTISIHFAHLKNVIFVYLDLLKAEKCLTEVAQKVHILKKSSFLLMTPFTFWALIAKCAILCGKSLHRVKIHKICYYFHFCNMLGVNWKWYFFSKEWFLQGKKLGKIDICKLVWRKKLTKF